MFHAVPLHPKLQISTRNGLVSVCWNVQQEMWCQHNFNLESVLSWLVPARGDVYIVYIPLFGYMHSAPVSTFTWQVIFVYIHLNIQGFVKFLVLSTVPQKRSLYEKTCSPRSFPQQRGGMTFLSGESRGTFEVRIFGSPWTFCWQSWWAAKMH